MPEPKATTPEVAEKTPAEGSGEGTPPKKPEEAKSFTQADVDRIAGEARTKERDKAKREKEDEDKTRQEAADKEAGKHKQLAEKFEAERDTANKERDDYKSKYETLAATVTATLEAEIKALPEGISELAPADLEARLEWLPKAKKMAEKLEGEPRPGNARGPKPAGATPQDAINEIADRKRRSGAYSR